MLAEKSQNLIDLWAVENAGHTNIDTDVEWRNQYFHKLRRFLLSISLKEKEIRNR